MYTDSRGRVRFTYNGTRFEISKDGVLRAYARDRKFRGSENSQSVKVTMLDMRGMGMLYRAVNQQRKNARG
jgi:hypothetical protein